MKTIIKSLALILGITLSIQLIASPNPVADAKSKLYKAYVDDNISMWQDGMNELSVLYTKTKNINTLFEVAKSQYGYMGLLIDRNQIEKAKEILPIAEKNIDELLKSNPDWPDANGLLAGIYGFKIILYPNMVIWNGPKGKVYMERASSLKNISPSIIIEMGNYSYHTPIILGGNIDDAINHYKKAISILETTKQDKNNWEYINTVVWLAISYDKKGETTEAKSVLADLLKKVPDLKYVKDDLYPKISKKESIVKSYYSMK